MKIRLLILLLLSVITTAGMNAAPPKRKTSHRSWLQNKISVHSRKPSGVRSQHGQVDRQARRLMAAFF